MKYYLIFRLLLWSTSGYLIHVTLPGWVTAVFIGGSVVGMLGWAVARGGSLRHEQEYDEYE